MRDRLGMFTGGIWNYLLGVLVFVNMVIIGGVFLMVFPLVIAPDLESGYVGDSISDSGMFIEGDSEVVFDGDVVVVSEGVNSMVYESRPVSAEVVEYDSDSERVLVSRFVEDERFGVEGREDVLVEELYYERDESGVFVEYRSSQVRDGDGEVVESFAECSVESRSIESGGVGVSEVVPETRGELVYPRSGGVGMDGPYMAEFVSDGGVVSPVESVFTVPSGSVMWVYDAGGSAVVEDSGVVESDVSVSGVRFESVGGFYGVKFWSPELYVVEHSVEFDRDVDVDVERPEWVEYADEECEF